MVAPRRRGLRAACGRTMSLSCRRSRSDTTTPIGIDSPASTASTPATSTRDRSRVHAATTAGADADDGRLHGAAVDWPDLPVPDDCVPLPDDAPALLVTSEDGVVYQVGNRAIQIVADSDEPRGLISTAWRAQGGAMWVSLGLGQSLGRSMPGTSRESGGGNASLQHVGRSTGSPSPCGSILGDSSAGATKAAGWSSSTLMGPGRSRPGVDVDGSITVGNIGAETVLLTRTVGAATRTSIISTRPAAPRTTTGTTPLTQSVVSDRSSVRRPSTTTVNADLDGGDATSGEMGGLRLVIGSTSGPRSNSG